MKGSKGKKIFADKSIIESVKSLILAACKLQHPFALYRLPDENDHFQFQLSLSPLRQAENISLEELSRGFVFSKFDGEKYFLEADIMWSSFENDLSIRETLNDSHSLESFIENLQEAKSSKISLPKKPSGLPEKSDQRFTELVSQCISGITEGHFEKIVPARAHLVEGIGEENSIEDFLKLCSTYPHAFVSLFSSSETGSWLGATPEVLVCTKEDDFETVALAGTQKYEGQELKNVAWTQKEIEEQAFVSRYIINCFKKIRLREFDEVGPKTVIAGNLLHLKTSFHVNMKDTNFPQLGTVMLKLLHPTSAVCGMPLEESLEFLRENEELERRFYAGFLGPVNVDDQTNIFVNLRCMEYTDEGIKLYAGAGVTEDSDPQCELEETELKFDTLRKILLEK